MKNRIFIIGLALLAISATLHADGGPESGKSATTVIFAPVFKTLNDGEVTHYIIRLHGTFLLVNEEGYIVRNLGDHFLYSDVYFRPVKVQTSALRGDEAKQEL